MFRGHKRFKDGYVDFFRYIEKMEKQYGPLVDDESEVRRMLKRNAKKMSKSPDPATGPTTSKVNKRKKLKLSGVEQQKESLTAVDKGLETRKRLQSRLSEEEAETSISESRSESDIPSSAFYGRRIQKPRGRVPNNMEAVSVADVNCDTESDVEEDVDDPALDNEDNKSGQDEEENTLEKEAARDKGLHTNNIKTVPVKIEEKDEVFVKEEQLESYTPTDTHMQDDAHTHGTHSTLNGNSRPSQNPQNMESNEDAATSDTSLASKEIVEELKEMKGFMKEMSQSLQDIRKAMTDIATRMREMAATRNGLQQ